MQDFFSLELNAGNIYINKNIIKINIFEIRLYYLCLYKYFLNYQFKNIFFCVICKITFSILIRSVMITHKVLNILFVSYCSKVNVPVAGCLSIDCVINNTIYNIRIVFNINICIHLKTRDSLKQGKII